MRDALEQIKNTAIEKLEACGDLKALDELKVKYLGKKGELTAILKQMGKLSPEERPVIGQLANEVRAKIEEEVSRRIAQLKEKQLAAQLAAENDRLTSENAKLSAKCGEYDATREKIAEMELSAYRRAKQIEEDAKVELQKLRRKSMETIEQVRRQLDATKENYRTVLARNQQESAELARKAGEVLGEIDKISASLGKKDGEAPHPEPDKTKNGLREVLNNLRPKTEE